MNLSVCGALLTAAMLLASCAAAEPARAESCTEWFTRLDEAIDRAGVRDAGSHRIAGFPYLRSDRFLASFRNEARDDPTAFGVWVDHLRLLDATARSYELRNLPASYIRSLGVPDSSTAIAKTKACAAVLSRTDLGKTSQKEALIAQAAVPDDYIEPHRILGLYPLATLPFWIGVDRWQRTTVAMFWRSAYGSTEASALVRYEPRGKPADVRQIGALFARTPADRLGVPQFRSADRELLLGAFAPVFEIGTSGDYDRFGPLAWGTGQTPEVNVRRPVVYRRLAFTRYGGQVLVQLVYTIWFPERPSEGSVDLLAGKLDGLIFRVTLDREGQPLVYDTIHPCGCYHMFFPTARVKVKPAPQPGIEWAFVPAILPSVDPARRIVLQVATQSHYIVGLHFVPGSSRSGYDFAEDDELRALPTIEGTTRSAFGPDGIVSGTERSERLLFWPTGVASTGAMRQWGRHATAFLGRRHFDDADLIERRFLLLSSPEAQ
jgi:hypothetical protein